MKEVILLGKHRQTASKLLHDDSYTTIKKNEQVKTHNRFKYVQKQKYIYIYIFFVIYDNGTHKPK